MSLQKTLSTRAAGIALLSSLLTTTVGPSAAAHGEAPGPETLGAAIREFGGELKSTLVGTLQNEGLTAAIAVCQNDAPRIAEELSARTGIELRRTAVRVRNPDNSPSAADLELLRELEEKLAAGENPDKAAVYRVADDRNSATLAKPIVMGAPCLACHGDALAPEVAAEIQARYPDDRATGFALGELRGAFIAVGSTGH